MKKRSKLFFCVFMIIMLASTSVIGQIHLGIKGGLNISSINLSEDILKSYNVTGFHLGPMIEVMTPLGIGFDGAILYSQKGMDVKGPEDALMTDYLEIPVNFKVKLGVPLIKAYATAGPFAEIRLSGAENKWERIQSQIKTKAFGAGLNLGIGAEVLSRIQVGLNYSIGLTDNYAVDQLNGHSDINIKSTTLSITAVLLF
ncbi:MAG: PorT family protein [Tannerellaceae bacterium]|nr:PorT family protein [Tannerellaceae bacterium]